MNVSHLSVIKCKSNEEIGAARNIKKNLRYKVDGFDECKNERSKIKVD